MSLSTQFTVPINREGIHKVWWVRLTLDLDLGQNLFFTRPNSQIKFPNFAIFLDIYFQALGVSVISSLKNSNWDIYKTFYSKHFLFFLITHCPLKAIAFKRRASVLSCLWIWNHKQSISMFKCLKLWFYVYLLKFLKSWFDVFSL